jgi:hypothetical protein
MLNGCMVKREDATPHYLPDHSRTVLGDQPSTWPDVTSAHHSLWCWSGCRWSPLSGHERRWAKGGSARLIGVDMPSHIFW